MSGYGPGESGGALVRLGGRVMLSSGLLSCVRLRRSCYGLMG